MLLCRSNLFVLAMVLASGPVELGAGPQKDNIKPTAGITTALGAIFADEHVAREALQIHDRALKLNEAARFELLSAWVAAATSSTRSSRPNQIR